MGKITINEMHNSLFDYTQAVSDENLMTENKTIVDAINEIYGKRLIADSIGEPLNNTDTFTKMSSDINNLLSTFKTNMMNSGVAVESGDKFKTLIDKIKGLTEGEGNKGIQFAEGDLNVNIPYNNAQWLDAGEIVVPLSLDFTPTYIFIDISFYNSNLDLYNNDFYISNMLSSKIVGGNVYGYFSLKNVSSDGFTISYPRRPPNYVTTTNKWYAIGVGEEDTTLRDSLASILQEEGVGVAEEDDMASLISKVDEEFDNRITMKTGTLNYTNGLVGENNNEKLIITHNLGTIPSYIVCRTSEMDYMPNDSSVGRNFTGSLCLTIDNSAYVTANGNRATLSITDITENTFTVLTTMETSGRLSGWIEEWIVMK